METDHQWGFTYGPAVTDERNLEAAYRYLSKYVANENEIIEVTYEGHRCGHSRGLPLDPIHEVRWNHFGNIEVRRWLRRRRPSARRYARVIGSGAPGFVFMEQQVYVAVFRAAWLVYAEKYGRSPPGRRRAPASLLRQRRERLHDLIRQRKWGRCRPIDAPWQLELCFG